MTADAAAASATWGLPWRALLLGVDHAVYGEVTSVASPDRRAAAAISVGRDRGSPSRAGKGDPDGVPNEDAALVIDEGDRALVAVADAHFGHEASHAWLRALARCRALPHDLDALRAFVASIPAGEAADRPSRSTLAVAVLDRAEGRVFGLSFGDSSVVLLGPGGSGEPLHPTDEGFVTPDARGGPTGGHPFVVDDVRPGATLVAFTDGVDGCCYGEPERSIRSTHLRAFADEVRDPEALIRRIAAAALLGVDGHPGGQDNVALAAAQGA